MACLQTQRLRQDAALLVLRHDDLQCAEELREGRRRQQRGTMNERRRGMAWHGVAWRGGGIAKKPVGKQWEMSGTRVFFPRCRGGSILKCLKLNIKTW